MSAVITVESLLKQCELKESDLISEIDRTHFLEISHCITKWKVLALKLPGFSEGVVAGIEADHSNEESKKIEFLELLKQKFTYKATYGLLVETLLKIERADDALRLLKCLASVPERSIPSNLLPIARSVSPKATPTISTGKMTISQGRSSLSQLSASSSSMACAPPSYSTTTNTPVSFSQGLNATASRADATDNRPTATADPTAAVVVQHDATATATGSTAAAAATDSFSNQEAVIAQLIKLEHNFAILKESLLNELKDKKVPVDRLTTKISCLKNDVNRYVYNYWRKIVDRNFGNLNELFTDLNANVWTILDYYLLGHFIEYLENDQLSMKLKAYTKQLDTFKKTTRVSDFVNCWRDSQIEHNIPDFENISIQYDEVPATLAELDQFRNSFKTKFFPSLIDCSSCIYYGKFQQKSSVSAITLYIPNEMAKELLKADKTSELFRMYKVRRMFIGNTEIFNRSEPATHDNNPEFQKMSPKGGNWSLTDIADNTQLGSPARLAIKRRMIQSPSNKDDAMRRLEQQFKECRVREEELQRRAGELQIQVNDANRRAEASNRRSGELQTQVEDANRRAEAYNRRAKELQTKVDDSSRRVVELQTQVEDANRRAEDSNRRAVGVQTQVQGAQERVQDLRRSLAETKQELRLFEDRLQANSTHWVVRREEIELTGPELGVGGWATVTVAKFRGIQVAVKRIHNQIISHHNLQLFQREMNMAARLRHPNLIQFIGATLEGDMMIVMELMATSLRSQLQRETYFQPLAVKAISLDVARGLNYLHLVQPDPIVHRDISSANVLLEIIPLNTWRAKLTDYGSVNLVHQLHTGNPGSPAYAAPEASNPRLQSPKMDIYSFGALVLEMLTGRLPAPDDRPGLFRKVQHEQLLHLMRRCLNMNRDDRPSAHDIISELDK